MKRAVMSVLAGALVAGLGACASMPQSGPSTAAVRSEGDGVDTGAYYVVPVSQAVLSALSQIKPRQLAPAFADRQPAPRTAVGVGDVLTVTIWESSGLFGGLAGTTSGSDGTRAVTLPPQTIDQSGAITVPFAGRVVSAGLSPAAVEQQIVAALEGKAYQPQVLVTVNAYNSTAVTVTGDVNRPGRVPLSPGGSRLLDAVALSGGSAAAASDTAVQLTREGVTRRVRLDAVLQDPSENIYLRPDDLLVLVREPQSVVVLGATEENEQVPFGRASMTLAEAVGAGGGLADARADPVGVFVFRYEAPDVARAVRPITVPADAGLAQTPVVYQINMREPTGLFMAQSFPLRDKDLIYVANTESVQAGKVIRLLREFSAIFTGNSALAD